MELAEDASAVVGNLEHSEVPMVDGGKARGIRLTPSQVYTAHYTYTIYVDKFILFTVQKSLYIQYTVSVDKSLVYTILIYFSACETHMFWCVMRTDCIH